MRAIPSMWCDVREGGECGLEMRTRKMYIVPLDKFMYVYVCGYEFIASIRVHGLL